MTYRFMTEDDLPHGRVYVNSWIVFVDIAAMIVGQRVSELPARPVLYRDDTPDL